MSSAARYRLERVLGRGRHAGIWLASDLERRDRVALKIAPRGSLREEFETLLALRDERVVGAHDCGTLPDGRAYLAMEFMPRGSLAQSARCAFETILLDAARALAAVHRRGWVHRDLKPAHFLWRAADAVALCDFGSACRAGTRGPDAAARVIGTPRYAAPEQMQGACASPAADVYSFGACMFELLAGQPPFRGETLTELFSQHLRASVPRLPREAAHWQPLVDALLAKDAARRPADGCAVHALAARLAPITGEVP